MSVIEEPTTRADVIAAYRLFLGRNPENEVVVDGHAGHLRTIGTLRNEFLASAEFRALLASVPYFLRDKWVLTETLQGVRMWVNLRDNVVSRAILDTGWEPGVTELVLGRLRKGDVFIDIGANIGWFTLQAAQRLRKLGGGLVYAFEPRSDLYAALARSVAENGLEDYVELCQAGLADRPGSLELFWFTGNENAAASALARGAVPDGAAHETVRLVRLDDLDIPGPVRLIKCDAEGAEGMIFAGAEELLRRERPEIVAELNIAGLPAVSGISADDWLESMTGRGYTCRLVNEDGTIGRDIAKAEETGDPAANILLTPA